MSLGDEDEGDAPKPDDIRAAIDRVTSSDIFVRSPQIAAFLRFVVDATLQGKSDRIKAYTIGVEVLRRDARFDPQIDPIVRVEGSRLRRSLERYYAGPGSDDPVIVGLPRGSYVPTFRYSLRPEPPVASSGMRAAMAEAARRRPFAALVVGLSAVLLAGGVGIALLVDRFSAPPTVTIPDDESTLVTATSRAHHGLPTLVVPALEVTGTPSAGSMSAITLHQKIGIAFARFDTAHVVVDSPANPVRPAPDYRVAGSVNHRSDGLTNVGFRLIDADNKVIWSRSFDRIAPDDGPDEREDAVVADLATILLQPYGVIRSRDLARYFGDDPDASRYRCILEASDVLRRLSRPNRQERAQQCLHRWIDADPGFTVAYFHLAEIYVQNFLDESGPSAVTDPPLERGLSFVRRGIELAPENAHGYRVMMRTRFYRKEYAAAFYAGDRAMALNPYDRSIAAEYGTKLIKSGDLEGGMTMMLRGIRDTQVLLPRHRFGLFIGSYLSGNMVDAVHYAKQLDDGLTPYSLLATALICLSRNEMDCARNAYERLIAAHAGWRDIDRELTRRFGRPSHIRKLASDLAPLAR